MQRYLIITMEQKKPVFDHLNSGKNVIFDIDSQALNIIKSQKIKYKIITFFFFHQ